MYISSAPINLNQGNQAININRGAFMKMMMLIDQNQQVLNQQTNMVDGLNIMELVTGKNANVSKLTDLSAMTLDLNEDVNINLADDDKTKLNILENFISFTNYMNFGNEKLIVEKSNPDNLNLEKNTSIDVNEFRHFNQDITQATHALEKTDKGDVKANFQIDKLIATIEENKKELKNKVDFNIESLSSKDPLIQSNNKIITVTDEATQIKSQVLTQVKDKIVFLTKEGSTTDNNIKQVTMELQPDNLGKVNIKMTFDDNKITVEIKALNEETQKILSTSVGELARILSKTTESSINVVVKNSELQYEQQKLNGNQNNDQRYNENYDEQQKHNKQKNYYYYEDLNKNDENDEDFNFSELINLRNIKLQ